MERWTLDLRLSVFAGPTTRPGALMLFGQIRSQSLGPPGHPSEFLVLCRDEGGFPPPWISASRVADQDIARLEALLTAVGFPRRIPRVVANKGPHDSGRNCVVLEVQWYGRGASWDLRLEDAGFSGVDAEPIRELLHLLGELAEAGGRPAFRAIVNRLVNRRASKAMGLIERGPKNRRGWRGWASGADIPNPDRWEGENE